MTDHAPADLGERVTDLEKVVQWLTSEVGALSERLMQATQVEAIIRRAHGENLLLWHDIAGGGPGHLAESRTSSVRNPGPRLLAGSTITR